MQRLFVKLSSAIFLCFFSSQATLSDAHWSQFLAKHDIYWDKVQVMAHRKTRDTDAYAFLANGFMGTGVFYSQFDNMLIWRLGRQDAYAWSNDNNHFKRIGIGDFVLPMAGEVVEGTMRKRLWDAELTLEMTTTKGSVKMEMFLHAVKDVVVIDLTATGEEKQNLPTFEPFDGNSEITTEGNLHTCIQPYDLAGNVTVAWISKQMDEGRLRIYLSIGHDGQASSREWTQSQVQSAEQTGKEQLLTSHRTWWHHFYKRHFYSIPDTRLESLYWINVYRLGCLWRPDGILTDNSGPWMDHEARWNRLTCDMNIQVQHLSHFGGNFADFSRPLVNTINNNLHNLAENMRTEDPDIIGLERHVNSLDLLAHSKRPDAVMASPRSVDEVADIPLVANLNPSLVRNDVVNGENLSNLGWALHSYYQYYRMTMDEKTGRNLFKLAKLNMRGFLHMLGEKQADGQFHLDGMYSPEIGLYDQPDANYGLSVIRWLCETILTLDQRYNLNDPERGVWEDVLQNLVPFPKDQNGYLVYPGHPVGDHRHWSHIVMIYPLNVVNWDQKENRELMQKSVDYWIEQGMQERAWSIGAASAMKSSMMDGDGALELLQWGRDQLRVTSTWGGGGGLHETPLIYVRAIRDLGIQSWGDAIRVFPAAPSGWNDMVMDNMRAQGNFSVSAVRKGGETNWIQITSHSGEPCRVWTDMPRPIQIGGDRQFTLSEEEDGFLTVDLQKDETVILYAQGSSAEMTIQPVADDGWTNWWGNKRKKVESPVALKDMDKSQTKGPEIFHQHILGKQVFTISLETAAVVGLEIYDAKGKQVWKKMLAGFFKGTIKLPGSKRPQLFHKRGIISPGLLQANKTSPFQLHPFNNSNHSGDR